MDFNDIPDKERRKLFKDFSQAAKEIQISLPAPEKDLEQAVLEVAKREDLLFEDKRKPKRPSYRVRVKIDSYAYTEGYEICGLKQYLTSLLSFLWPNRDYIHNRFAKAIVRDSPYRADPSGYSLSRALLEIKQSAEFLLKGGKFLKRSTDPHQNVGLDLKKDLIAWEPFGYQLLKIFSHPEHDILGAIEYIKHKYDSHLNIDSFELIDIVKSLYRLALRTDASFPVVKEHLENVEELIVSLYKRIYTNEQKVHQVVKKIDSTVCEFLSAYMRLKWFVRELYPAILKHLNLFKEEENANTIARQIFDFIRLDRSEILKAESMPANKKEIKEREEKLREAVSFKREVNFKEEYKGILTILSYAFPGSQIKKIGDGDFSSLSWFHQKIFNRDEYRKPIISRRADFSHLLWKISRKDPLAPVILLHDIIEHMLDALEPDAISRIADPMSRSSSLIKNHFFEIKHQWTLARTKLLNRYLQEIDYFETETSLSEEVGRKKFIETAAGRKTVETINQIRNYIIRDYGHVALNMNRKDYFSCRPFYGVTQDLLKLMDLLITDRSQLVIKNPIILSRLEQNTIIQLYPSPILKQIKSYIDAVPREKRLLKNTEAESQRLFLEILFGLVDLLNFLLNSRESVLKSYGGEVVPADKEDKAIREAFERDKTPLRVELKRDFDDIDQLTGLWSKNEYIRNISGLFKGIKEKKECLSFLIIDLDHFKAVNDSQGHEFGDQFLHSIAEAIRSSMRDDDMAVRFGGEEILVILRGDYPAGFHQAERIRRRCGEMISLQYSHVLDEIPEIIANRELKEERESSRSAGGEGRLKELIDKWQNTQIGTLSIGVAQGLGENLSDQCADEKELFIRADKLLYLAKESGRNRVVAMVDELKTPLLYSEFMEYQEFLGVGSDVDPLDFIKLRSTENRPLTFRDYPYWEYLRGV